MSAGQVIYAVIDTNVLVSALLSRSSIANPLLVIRSVLTGNIVPLLNSEIINEYKDVLSRPKFGFKKHIVNELIDAIIDVGYPADRISVTEAESFPDIDDVVFYEVAMSVDDAYLVTGNTKHFPTKPFIVTPAEMVVLLKEKGLL